MYVFSICKNTNFFLNMQNIIFYMDKLDIKKPPKGHRRISEGSPKQRQQQKKVTFLSQKVTFLFLCQTFLYLFSEAICPVWVNRYVHH